MDVTVTFNRGQRVIPVADWHGLAVRTYRSGRLQHHVTLLVRARPPRVIIARRCYDNGRPLGPEREWTRPKRRDPSGA